MISPQRGAFSFTGQYSNQGYSDLLLGYPTTTQRANPPLSTIRYLQPQYATYIQDDWRVTPKLTLNVGIRYDLQWQEQNPYGLDSMFVPSLKEVVVFAKAFPSATLPGIYSGLSSTISCP